MAGQLEEKLGTIPEQVFGVVHKLGLNSWKHCLVKWKGLDFDQSTWELV